MGLETEGLGRIFNDTLNFDEGYRLRFGRRIVDKVREVEFEIDGDTAIGSITYNINGILYVKAFDTTDNIQIDSISFSKTFQPDFREKYVLSKLIIKIIQMGMNGE